MPKKYRLSRADFMRLPRSGGRRVHGNYFSLTASALPAGTSAKAACVVSKRIAKHAHDRNAIERKTREALRPLIAGIRQPLALVLYAKREATSASQREITQDIQKLVARIHDT